MEKSNEHMILWNKVKSPPASALKTIQAGRLKGMTDIKPMFRYQIMTEVYGLCGIGWKYIVVNKWLESGSENQIFAFADVDLFVKVDGEWSEPIQGNGGSMLVTKEKAGLHSSDEAYKMAITDALSTAMKMIGVAADVYLGNWDGSKYKEEPVPPVTQKKELLPDTQNWKNAVAAYIRDKNLDAVKKRMIVSPENEALIKAEAENVA